MSGHSYKDAGVDVDAAAALVQAIKPLARSTARPGSDTDIGGFGGLFDPKAAGYDDPVLVASTDGVGTKLRVALDAGLHRWVGIDLVAMCVNDIVVQGAEPLLFLDYFATGKLDVARAEEVIAGIAEGCRIAGCALVGGETAEMPGMYAEDDYDLAGFCVGAARRDAVLTGADVAPGDVVLGLASTGVHSNGFSLVRRIVADGGFRYGDDAPFGGGKLGEALLTPTRIYVKSCLAAHRSGLIRAMAHITGGGIVDNLPRVMPDGTVARIDASAWELPPVFRWLGEAGGVAAHELARTFNCGIGMALVTAADKADAAMEMLRAEGETVYRIGVIESAPGKESDVILEGTAGRWPG